MARNAGLAALLAAGVLLATGGWLALRRAGESVPASAPAAKETPTQGDLLVVGIATKPATLLAPFAVTEDESEIASLLTPTLCNTDLRGETVHVPGLADRWEWSPDGKTITFHLKEAKWDDGEPVTATDVAATYALVRDERYASPRREYFERVESVRAIDPRTVTISFGAAYYRQNQLSDVATIGILPARVCAALAPDEARGTPSALRPVGHGKFRIVDVDPEHGWTLERNPAVVSDAVPWLHRVRLRPIEDRGARLNALRSEQIDVMDGVPAEEVDRVRAEGFQVFERTDRSVDYVVWNRRRPLFDDRDVRRALTLAIDRAGMNQAIFRSPVATIREPIGATSPLLADAYARDVVPLPHDPAEAERILEAKGWRRGAGGTREKERVPFRFRLVVNRETAHRTQTATMIQQDLRKVGIDVEIDAVGFSELGDRARRGDFDAAIYGVQAPLQLKQGDLWKSGAPYNFADYRNPEVDHLVDGMREQADRARICEDLKQIQRIVYADQPVTFLRWFGRFVAVGPRFRDFHADALSSLGYLERCWVPLGLQRFDRGE
ncbi:MAG TPA: ABC transporter substrate-binding protein [Planctomycetota bacterium]|nr:ABC transporter substrate-binding protein [Planctomycetota bacterium]